MLNSTSAVVLEDFIKGCMRIHLKEKAAKLIVKGVVCFLGVVAVAFLYVVEHLGGVLAVNFHLNIILFDIIDKNCIL